MKEIVIGSETTSKTNVTEEKLAVNVGSGDLRVFATPMMTALMENAASKCLAQFLDDCETSVGTALNIVHTSATPLGMEVSTTAKIISVDGRKVDFEVFATDETGEIGRGTHTRFVVNSEKFQTKTDSKLNK